MSKSPKKPTLQEYQDAVWRYILEHSDVNHHGALFVKFHTDGRGSFERRIRARLRGYSRRDTRLDCTPAEKEQLHLERREAFIKQKKMRQEKWKADREEKRRVFEQLKRTNERNQLLGRYPRVIRPLINKSLDFYATARITMVQFKHRVLRLLRSTSDRDCES